MAAAAVARDSATIARGAHLTSTYAGCVDCHGANYGGRVVIDDPAIGRLVGSNLTTGRGGVLAGYSDAALDRAIRHGLAPDGRKLRFMPSHEFRQLADADVAAIIAYLRSLPPVDSEHPATRIGPLARVLHLAGQFPLLPYDRIDHAAPVAAAAPTGVTTEHGAYIANACVGCHGAGLSGGKIPGAPPAWKPASNITTAGIGSWSEDDFLRAMRTGVRPGGTTIDSLMPWRNYRHMHDDELRALYRYLRTVGPRAYGMR
ncbi:MAG: cytochrome c [Gemmatimonadaceae bacterium]|nr:cytochrome c [Gemmatimonadaceae bacterium]